MPSLLHVLNGDATREKLERAGVPGDIIVWADVLHDGPVPGGLSAEEFRRVRARHLASYRELGISEEEALRRLQERDAGLERYPAYDEVVFWFEHDLFDQLILIRHLHWLAHTQAMEERIFMGDLTFWGLLTRLADAPHPLVELSPSGNDAPMVDRRVRSTDTGRDVLAGRADHVVLKSDRSLDGRRAPDR